MDATLIYPDGTTLPIPDEQATSRYTGLVNHLFNTVKLPMGGAGVHANALIYAINEYYRGATDYCSEVQTILAKLATLAPDAVVYLEPATS